MSCNLIRMEKGHKVARPITSKEEYLQLRGSSAQLANLRLARAGNAAAKRRLVQFNYSGHYPEGVVKGCKLPSAAFGFDIDDREAFEKAARELLSHPEEYGLLMLERSVNQGGHAIFKREKGRTILENQVRIATALRCEMDTSAHDINRVYFTTSADPDDLLFLSPALFTDTYDPFEACEEANTLEEREEFGQEELPPEAHKANKHFKPYVMDDADGQSAEEPASSADGAGSSSEVGQASAIKEAGSSANPGTLIDTLSYLGISYEDIIHKWWEIHYNGREPVHSNRDTLTYELAVNLRHICGFDRNLLARVIPCYDGFPEAQKMKCIDSALTEKRTLMPRRLSVVLEALMADGSYGSSSAEPSAEGWDDPLAVDELYYYEHLPKLPQGVRESVEAVGPTLAMSVLTAICPVIGMLATGVELDVHGVVRNLNLIAYIAGDFASGKGSVDPVIAAWLSEQKAQDKVYLEEEEDWRREKRAAKNRQEQPKEPKLPIRCLTLNNTVANLAERLGNTDGKHAFSFTPEADTVAQKWKSAMSDFSVMIRQSYDGSSYEREARSAEAVNVHIDKLLWNITMCGTPDALYRVVNNYTDGFQSRIAVARTPDNTFAPLAEKPYVLTPELAEQIRQVAHLLPLMSGSVVLPKLESRGRAWLERIRLATLENDDKVKARQRFRICVTAQRMTCCLLLCQVCEELIRVYGLEGAEKRLKLYPGLWKEQLLEAEKTPLLDIYDLIADMLMENALYFFRSRIEQAFASSNYVSTCAIDRSKRGKNDSIFNSLDQEFTFAQAMHFSVMKKGATVTRNAVSQMLKNWRKQGLIGFAPDNKYHKLS
ncbi:hypothetical protein JQM83_12075 [Parabacteroides distasonis]|nr:hypothetical protein [Parabacteroides distasonis]